MENHGAVGSPGCTRAHLGRKGPAGSKGSGSIKIVFLAAANCTHAARWANSLQGHGHEVTVLTKHPPLEIFHPGIRIVKFPSWGKLGYFFLGWQARKTLSRLRPDIVHAHYASGYGTAARLLHHRPWLLSVYGTDVFEFPEISRFHRALLMKNLLAADQVASTSRCMARKIQTLVPAIRNIWITPFGVDLKRFSPAKAANRRKRGVFTIGTVKKMSDRYGIDLLVQAFALFLRKMRKQRLAAKINLRLVGDGPGLPRYKTMVKKLGIEKKVAFVGRVEHGNVPDELAKMDVFAALSRQESFGVAVLEACAARRPVIVSDAEGLLEVTRKGAVALVVPSQNPHQAALAMEKLFRHEKIRNKLGKAGYEHVQKFYDWDHSIQKMTRLYQKTIKAYASSTETDQAFLPPQNMSV